VRDTLLLSHANPEDNEFTLWLALQLANEGYRVWLRIPGQGEKDSGVNAKTIPGRWRTGFRADREQ
jgi:hypothetical protein